jgi:hypothetical protein
MELLAEEHSILHVKNTWSGLENILDTKRSQTPWTLAC